MKLLQKFGLSLVLAAAVFAPLMVVAPQPVNAQISVCTFIRPLCDALGLEGTNAGEVATGTVARWVNLGVTVVFAGILLVSVYVIVTNAVKYIQSQGEEGKIQEAQKAIKSVFIGIALLFVGVIGIVLVLAFFGGDTLLGFLGGDALSDCTQQCEGFSGAIYEQCVNSCQR